MIPERVSQSVSHSDKFIQCEIHSWTAVKSWTCGTLCVCIRVHAFNPSVICFLLPSHECRDFSTRLKGCGHCGKILLLAASLNASAAAAGEEGRKQNRE